MRPNPMNPTRYIGIAALLCGCSGSPQPERGTTLPLWPGGKNGAVSITYDDGSRKQFSVALPLMRQLDIPATFFIITGPLGGSRFPPHFVGRPVRQILRESATIPTDKTNFFERASAALYLGYAGALDHYNRADASFESGHEDKAFLIMDSLYRKARTGALPRGRDTSMEYAQAKGPSWDDIRRMAAEGYEFASHTVTHAHLAVLDTPNMRYELEKSRDEIAAQLGPAYTFSAEVPFGIDDPRVMRTAMTIYPALRNRMPDTFMTEINRGDRHSPLDSSRTYVQWQRGPLSATPLPLMRSWVYTTASRHNIWLVLVFHGIDDLGWEPTPHEKLADYFRYIADRRDSLWIAPFGEVARYVRERMAATVTEERRSDSIVVHLSHDLDPQRYDHSLSLRTAVPEDWARVRVVQGDQAQTLASQGGSGGRYVVYDALPNQGSIRLHKAPASDQP